MSESKSRRFVLSFGDIMLPLIGIVAMALLFIAGRLFFFSESRPAVAGLPVIKEAPVARTTQSSVKQSVPQSQPKPTAKAVVALPVPTPLNAVPPENFSDRPAVAPRSESTDTTLAVPYKPASQTKPITAPTPSPAPAPARRPAPKPAPSPVVQPSPTAKPSPAKPSPMWMVQAGAFSTAAAANAYSKDLSNNGYSASVVSGARLHKVFVRGGATRTAAMAIAAQIGQGAFAVPPDAVK